MKHTETIRVLDRLIAEMDLAIIKAKAQLEYIEDDTISGDLMRDE
tara:strand:+ start:682 stop:816 length:135 start_codon:yes stop_codon:yes gene_type:complete